LNADAAVSLVFFWIRIRVQAIAEYGSYPYGDDDHGFKNEKYLNSKKFSKNAPWSFLNCKNKE
jgi:hypothetical protein